MALWADTSAPDIMAQERTGARVSLTRPVLTCPVNSKRPATQATTDPGGGALGYFLGRYVPPRTPNWHLVLKKMSPKIDTPF